MHKQNIRALDIAYKKSAVSRGFFALLFILWVRLGDLCLLHISRDIFMPVYTGMILDMERGIYKMHRGRSR